MIIIRRIDNNSFEYDGEVMPTGFMAWQKQGKVDILYKFTGFTDLAYGLSHTNIQTQDAKGKVLQDGSDGATLNQIVTSVNEIVNFKLGGGRAIEGQILIDGAVETFADLPANPTADAELFYLVRTATGTWRNGLKRAGVYQWHNSKWTRLGALPDHVASKKQLGAPPHSSDTEYFEGNFVYHSGTLYRCKADIRAKAFDAGDWEEFKTGSEPLVLEHTDDVKDASGLITSIYNAYSQGTHWVVDLYTASTDTRTTATPTNNPSYATLADAWADRTTLTYA